ncbi:putative sulfate exporter family transporter [Streptomyces sp. NPDC026673]|uniref:YeiH family protein n=1 Tax=Streptomyces sp. NPDC026673 TaxID=3155724 RepID=UPI0033F85D44
MAARSGGGASRRTAAATVLPGLLVAAVGAALATVLHVLLPAVPVPTTAVVLGIAAANLPGVRSALRGRARPGLTFAGKRLMRIGIVILGLQLSLDDVLGLGWATAGMVVCVVAATFWGTVWLGRRMGLRGDQPLLIATGYSICGASAIGAVSQVTGSEEEDVAASVALVTLCGTLAIGVLPLLHHPLGLDDVQFGRWAGAGVHDVGQVVATAQTAGPAALGEAVLVKLMRVALLAPLVAAVGYSFRRRRAAAKTAGPGGAAAGPRTPLLPLFVVGFLVMIAVRSTGILPAGVLDGAQEAQQLLLAMAMVGLGSMVNLPTLARTGPRVAAVGLISWTLIATVSYAGVLLTT